MNGNWKYSHKEKAQAQLALALNSVKYIYFFLHHTEPSQTLSEKKVRRKTTPQLALLDLYFPGL